MDSVIAIPVRHFYRSEEDDEAAGASRAAGGDGGDACIVNARRVLVVVVAAENAVELLIRVTKARPSVSIASVMMSSKGGQCIGSRRIGVSCEPRP